MLYNLTVKVKDADEAWLRWFAKFCKNAEDGLVYNSRDGEVVDEVINAVTIIEDPTRCIMTNPIRKMPFRYALGELLWYASGSHELKDIQKYTKGWDRMSDDGKTVNSNYGYCIRHKYDFNQWEYVKNLLTSDPNTRQAVIHIKEPRNTLESPTKDLNCTVCLQFFIRDEKLYMTVYMRSNDIWMGFPFDVFQFTALQIKMAMELHIGIGTYTHIAGSLHMYKRDYDVAKSRVEELKASNKNSSK